MRRIVHMTPSTPTPPMASLRRLALLAARGKRRAPDVARFLLDVDANVARLADDLATAVYRPGRGRDFVIRDPKPRWIHALPFRDRVAQHWLIHLTLPRIERSLAPQTYACRTGKGTHRCLARAAALTRNKRFVLRVDVRKFFPSIDHAVLKRQLERTTPVAWRWLRDVFLEAPGVGERVAWHMPGDDLFTPLTRPHGLPIGSLTSQIWANVYLSPFDRLIASKLGIGTFVRYCDDLLIYDDDASVLRDALAALHEAAIRLRLRLHPDKTRLHRTTDPVAFLGFVLQRRGDAAHVRLRHENVRRMRARMATLRSLYEAGAIDVDDLGAHLAAWLAHAKHGHTTALVRAELERLRFTHLVDDLAHDG